MTFKTEKESYMERLNECNDRVKFLGYLVTIIANEIDSFLREK